MAKKYDRAYFDKWYRGPARVTTSKEQRRKVTMAVAVTEYFLRRTIRNVLDVGCGEAPWFVHLTSLRPRLTYRGIDPSDYAVRAFGGRNVKRGSFNDLSAARGEFDLVVCSDVMHYLSDADLRDGLPEIVKRMRGAAFFEVFTKEDHIHGDIEGFQRRPAQWYRDAFGESGLVPVAPYMWISSALADDAAALEVADRL